MIRPFDWRDLGLLNRVRDEGQCFDSQLAFTRGVSSLQTVFMEMVTPGRSACTLVSRPPNKEEPATIGQIMHRAGEVHARLTFFGPEEALASANSQHLLEALGHVAGERGAHHLIAEVDERCPAFENLRRAGFAIYARQRILQLNHPSTINREATSGAWQAERDSDESAIHYLCLNIVPALVQQVELPPRLNRSDLVHWNEGELHCYLDIESGPLGTWVSPYIHPAAENLEELFRELLTHFDTQKRPLYFVVRSYQAWVGHILERIGFEACSDQAVMVKRLAAVVRRPALAPLPAVEGTRPEPTTPFAHFSQASWCDLRKTIREYWLKRKL
jgi:hypothetical protein